jgi:two-component system phosphate regulon sensor histidine kinase PhoR
MLNRILMVFLSLTLVAMFILGVVSISALQGNGEELSKERLSDAAELVHFELGSGQEPGTAARLAADVFTSETHMVRLTLIAKDGSVLADTGADPSGLDNHLTRPEVARAFATGGTSWDSRYSDTLKMDMMYFARYDSERRIVIRSSEPLSQLRLAGAALKTRIAVVAVVLFLLCLGVGLLSIRTVSRPLVEMKDAAVAISTGRYDLRVHRMLGDRSDIGRLSSAFNAMADRLETSIADLEDKTYRMDAILDALPSPLFGVDSSLHVTFRNAEAKSRFGWDPDDDGADRSLILSIRSRAVEESVRVSLASGKRIEMEWRQEADEGMRTWRVTVSPLKGRDGGATVVLQDMTEMIRLQRVRSDFAANVTHELSTPITAIRGFIETLRGGASSDPELAARFLEIIDVEAERLHRLIDDILTLSEIEGGRAESEPVRFDLNERIDRSVVLLEETAAKRGVQLIAGPPRKPGGSALEDEEIEESGPVNLEVGADPDRINQLLVNLLDNAIKYNRKDGTVWIWAGRGRDGRVQLHVKDTGIGIAEEQKARIFERFYRVDAGRSRESGGTGLGLSIVNHIALLYKGNVRIESEPGSGSEFIVSLEI